MPIRATPAMAVSAALTALLCGSGARAHEIGATRVSVLFEDRRAYAIEIVTDAAALAEKLEAAAGAGPSLEVDPARLEASLQTFEEMFRQRVKVMFDESEVRPEIAYEVLPSGGAVSAHTGRIKLTGQVPEGARRFRWMYGWTFASYSLTVRPDRPTPGATEWLEGGQTSAPFALAKAAPPAGRFGVARRYLALGFTHIVPHGLDHMLFVLGIFLLSGSAGAVLWQVSAFTAAHSITLALSMYGGSPRRRRWSNP